MLGFGQVKIPEQWLWIGIALVLTLLIIYFVEKKWCERALASSLAYEIVLLFIISWKASLILLNLSLVLTSPLSLLYFTGGSTGFIIALLFSTGYAVWKIWKTNNQRVMMFLLFAALEMTAATIGVFAWLLDSGSIWVVLLHAILIGLLLIWKSKEWRFLDFAVWGGILFIILEYVYGNPMVLGLSEWQWIYLIVSGSAALMNLHIVSRRSEY
ncbi:hypothetical protein ABFG93_08830 [Pseudalkalibacillus hwajinpoensis]|uniref:hypothetical protein n=1 Tax=Guptibacillus hwajinpoensis TaxID=208199 RepID=UPI00325AA828